MLLFDQNISFRIVRLLRDSFPGCTHISKQGLLDATDRQIWEHARQSGLAIVTFDQDYIELAAISGHPPKIILLRGGNTTTLRLAHVLRKHKERIMLFLHTEGEDVPAVLELA
ncbi:MAG TPA: DUF5615 family PIN-like protein [Flavobacteriales bacterium]|nr:DUF5615 family PIN-like protein [Flavobacteriales bacterium]